MSTENNPPNDMSSQYQNDITDPHLELITLFDVVSYVLNVNKIVDIVCSFYTSMCKKFIYFFSLFLLFGYYLAGFVISITEWRSCEYAIHIFLLIESILCFLSMIMFLMVLWDGDEVGVIERLRTYYIVILFFIFLRLFWFVLGSYWLYSTDNTTCGRRLLWDWTAAYYIINYMVLIAYVCCNILNASRPLLSNFGHNNQWYEQIQHSYHIFYFIIYNVGLFGTLICSLSVPCILCGYYELCYVDHIPYMNVNYSYFLIPFSALLLLLDLISLFGYFCKDYRVNAVSMLITTVVIVLFLIALYYIINEVTPGNSSKYVESKWPYLLIQEKRMYGYRVNNLLKTYRNNMDRVWVVLFFSTIFLIVELVGHLGTLYDVSKISILKVRIRERRRKIIYDPNTNPIPNN